MSVQARAHLFCFFLVLMVATGWSSNCGAKPKNQADLPSSIEQTTDCVIEALTSRGFEVSRGYFRLYTQDDCEISFPVMRSCYGNNPAAPYVTFAVEPWPEEFLDQATENAIGQVRVGYTGTFRDFLDLQGSSINLVGPECTEIGMNCIGDGQDSSYQMTPDFLLDTGYVYAVAGTLGTRTGNATYVGLSLNDSYLIKGVANIDSDRLRNTASAYAADLTNHSKFYLYYLARNCAAIDELTDSNCFAVSEEALPVCTDLDSPDCHPLKLMQREYISKGTARGPESTLLLPPKLIRLQIP